MANDAIDEEAEERLTIPRAFFIGSKYLLADIIFYGTVFPLVGTLLANIIGNIFDLRGSIELVFNVLITFAFLYTTLWLLHERFIRHFLALEPFYLHLIKIRDLVNTVSMIAIIISLHRTIIELASLTSLFKSQNIGQGALYYYLKGFCQWIQIDPSFLTRKVYGFGYLGKFDNEADQGALAEESLEDRKEYELRAGYAFLWAMLSASVAKFVYFNTLFTMQRSMEIFLSLKPIFLDDYDYNETLEKDYRSVNFSGLEKPITTRERKKDTIDMNARASASANQFSYVS